MFALNKWAKVGAKVSVALARPVCCCCWLPQSDGCAC